MTHTQVTFNAIADALAAEHKQVTRGKMMSSPGIRYKDKNFAFFHKGQMVFKLGRETDPETLNVSSYSILSPFKTKPPLVDWFQIPVDDQNRWEPLARQALKRMMEELGA